MPPARLAQCHAVVIGVGAVGRQVALQLAAVGVPQMTLIDHDTVAVENLAPQGFWESDLGRSKVEAVADIARRQFPAIKITNVPERFRASAVRTWPADREVAIFCAVDSIDVRKLIWEAVRSRAGFFADGRMLGEVIRVLASGALPVDRLYETTLFPGSEAMQGSCTSRSTIYAANITAGLMLAQFAHHLRGLAVVPDQLLNLVAAEYTASELVF